MQSHFIGTCSFGSIMSKFFVATVCLAGAELYCPDDSSWVNEGASLNNDGWTVHGSGGVTGKTSFNLLGGYVEFDVDNGGSKWGVNNNFYTISPDHAMQDIDDSGRGPSRLAWAASWRFGSPSAYQSF